MSIPNTLQRGLQLPVIASPMFIISNPELVIAQCKAGIIGSFPALNARPHHVLEEWLERIVSELAVHDEKNPDRPAAPFAVNQIVHKSNDRLDQDLELCVKYQAPLVITSLGAREEVNDAVHSYGGIVMHDVIDQRFARKAIEKGADGLILVAAGAGGHAGNQSPFALVQETREWFDGPIALSGAIARGNAILAAQTLGADFAYIGSAFIATDEANAVDAYKQAIVEGDASSIVRSSYFTGVAGNYLRNSIIAAGMDPERLPEGEASAMNFGSKDASGQVVKAWRDVWGAGQGIGAVKQVRSAGALIEQWAIEYQDALKVRKFRQFMHKSYVTHSPLEHAEAETIPK